MSAGNSRKRIHKRKRHLLNYEQMPLCHYERFSRERQNPNLSPIRKKFGFCLHGDPYGNRTHVTAVKGRCLNRLTNGPGSGDLT